MRPFVTIEDQLQFFDEFPEWSPVLDEDARVIGVACPSSVAYPYQLVPFTQYWSEGED